MTLFLDRAARSGPQKLVVAMSIKAASIGAVGGAGKAVAVVVHMLVPGTRGRLRPTAALT
jgi:hypothetical protein